MDISEMKDYYDLDTFDDKLAEKAAKKDKKKKKEQPQNEGSYLHSPIGTALTLLLADNDEEEDDVDEGQMAEEEEHEEEEEQEASSEDEASDAEDQDESKPDDEVPQGNTGHVIVNGIQDTYSRFIQMLTFQHGRVSNWQSLSWMH